MHNGMNFDCLMFSYQIHLEIQNFYNLFDSATLDKMNHLQDGTLLIRSVTNKLLLVLLLIKFYPFIQKTLLKELKQKLSEDQVHESKLPIISLNVFNHLKQRLSDNNLEMLKSITRFFQLPRLYIQLKSQL